MQNQKGVSTLVGIMIIIAVAVVAFGGVFVYQYFSTKINNQLQIQSEQQNQNQGVNSENTNINTIKDNYSFNAIENLNSNKQYPDESIEIYKNQKLVKEIDIKDSFEKLSLFTLSPDQKYVAFRVATYGGTCVYFASPMIIDLNNFSIVNLDRSDINKKLGKALRIDASDINKLANKATGFSASVQEIKDIKWISNDKVEASMKFGDKSSGGCPIEVGSNYNSANFPKEVETNVDFTIIK